MATSFPQSPGGHDHKPDDTARNEHIERALDNVESRPNDDAIFSKFPKMDKVDEFGAHAKTDPREIALVKKLDKYILVRSSLCHWNIFLFLTGDEAYAMVHVPFQLPRSQRARQCEA